MTPIELPEPATYTVSVRALCEFGAKAGDLDLRFTPAPTAQQGRQGHAIVAQRRGPQYEREVSLMGTYQELRVRGRADGFDPSTDTLEEVKTFRGSLSAMAANHRELHWAQLRVYGWLMCQARELSHVTLTLVYFDIGDQTEYPLSEAYSAEDLRGYYAALCERFLGWARQELAHRRARDAALDDLDFPQLPFRPGQRDLAAGVYRACVQSRGLLVQAPTGIGKTMGTLYPALRAMPVRGIDKLFYLTAKTPGRRVALDALVQVRGSGAPPTPLRVVELVARDKSCEHPDKACHGSSCPLANGFYDRLPQARQHAAQMLWMDQASIRAVALDHHVCPYYLAQEMVHWSDVVVGDYNYYFDRSAMLYAMTLEGSWRVSVLVDEAHNLYSRACTMYSADCTLQDALQVRPHLPKGLRPRLDDWISQWRALVDPPAEKPGTPPHPAWQLLTEWPAAWFKPLQRLNSVLGEYLADHPTDTPPEVLAYYFKTLGFALLAEEFGDHSLCELDTQNLEGAEDRAPQEDPSAQIALVEMPDAEPGRVTLRNVVPAHFLAPRLQAADSWVLFSATLNPPDYYIHLLGLPETTPMLDIPTPFRPEQLQVSVLPISTRRDDRQRTLEPLVQAMAEQYRRQPGNYLAFFSSFDYLDMALQHVQQFHPDVVCWAQARAMDEASRARFLQRFDPAGQGIAFAVLGGVFGEGVDLPGKQLIGAFIATLGLPQFDDVNQAICERMDTRFGRGHDYAYVYPGMQKVVQAAGRVIRTEQDTGTVLLLDDRFLEHRYRSLLPAWWRIEVMRPYRAFIR